MSVMPVTKLPQSKPQVPPLENGDHLDQETFHERYEAMPVSTHAELIRGVVFMASPVGEAHADSHPVVIFWLGLYMAMTSGVKVSDNPTIILAEDSEPQPDAVLRLVHGKTKRARRGQTDYISGPPELIAEIAASTESIDLFEKRRDYEEYGVGEYIAFLIRTGRVIWFVRESGRFVELSPDADGILRSRLFPGLWLDPVALLAGDLRRVQEVLTQGVATPEHVAFAAELATRQSSPAEKP